MMKEENGFTNTYLHVKYVDQMAKVNGESKP
jgi:hypothetical protein